MIFFFCDSVLVEEQTECVRVMVPKLGGHDTPAWEEFDSDPPAWEVLDPCPLRGEERGRQQHNL